MRAVGVVVQGHEGAARRADGVQLLRDVFRDAFVRVDLVDEELVFQGSLFGMRVVVPDGDNGRFAGSSFCDLQGGGGEAHDPVIVAAGRRQGVLEFLAHVREIRVDLDAGDPASSALQVVAFLQGLSHHFVVRRKLISLHDELDRHLYQGEAFVVATGHELSRM